MLNASTETTASSRISARQPQPRDAKQPQAGFSSLVDDNAASKTDAARDPAPRESDQAPRSSASQKTRDSREQDDRTTRDSDRSSSSDDAPTADAIKTDAPAGQPKKVAKEPDKSAAEQPAQSVVDATTADPAAILIDAGKTAEPVPAVAVTVAVVPTPAPVAISTAPAPLAIAAAGIAAAKAAAAKASDTSGTDTTDQASLDPVVSAPPATAKAAASAAEAVVVKTEIGPTPSGTKAATDETPDTPAPVTAKIAPKPDATATNAKPKTTAATDDATPSAKPHLQPQEHHAAAAAPDVAVADPQPVLPQPAVHTATPVSATAQLTATVATAAPVPLNGLAVELAARAQSGATRFDIRLDPAELGRIDVRIDIDKQGQVTSHLTVEKPETLAMLRQDSPQLQRALNDAGLKTSDNGLQFTLGDQSQPRQQTDSGDRQTQRFIIRDDETNAPATPARGYGRMFAARSGVDISV